MGQARARGTREQRVVQATQRDIFTTDITRETQLAIGDLESGRRSRLLEIWNTRAAGLQSGDASAELIAFRALLNFIWRRDWHGACHSSAAVLYVLLAELGMRPTLCIGELAGPGLLFDHSWVELDGRIQDAAISLPSKGGNSRFAGGPVFRSFDLSTAKETNLTFGAKSEKGLIWPASEVSERTLSQYVQLQIDDGVPPDGTIWATAVQLCSDVGVLSSAQDLEARYGSVNRTIRG